MDQILITTSSFGHHDPGPLEMLTESGYEVRMNPHGRRLTTDESRNMMHRTVGLLAGTERLSMSVLETAPLLKVISRCGVGLDSIDLGATEVLGIKVLNTTDAHVDAVAELTLGGILDVLRHLSRADRRIRRQEWRKPMGQLLKGKTVGIVGLGRTGRRLVELLGPFSGRILAFDVAVDTDFAAANPVTYGSLETVIEESDILTLHLGYSPETHHLIDAARIAEMKPGAILVNAARGGLVDETALEEALRSGHLAGAYLDVYEEEPYTGALTDFDNVLLTPHIGSYAIESRIAMEREAAKNLLEAMTEIRR